MRRLVRHRSILVGRTSVDFWSVERRSIAGRVIDTFIIRFSIIGSSSGSINIRTHMKDKLTYILSTIYITPNLEFTLYVTRWHVVHKWRKGTFL